MNKTYLITGAAGWMGKRMVDILCKNNIDGVKVLRLVDKRFSLDFKDAINHAAKSEEICIEWIVGDVTDLKHMKECTKGVDVIIHSAAIVDFLDEFPHERIWNVNVKGTENILQCCFVNNVRFCVYTSSISALGPNKYGHPLKMGNESTPYLIKPAILYAQTKRESEEKMQAANGQLLPNGKFLRTCSLRLPRIYGGDDLLFRKLFGDNQDNKTVYAVSKQEAAHNCIHVDNAAWGHILAAKRLQERENALGGKIYLLGDDTPPLSSGRFNHLFLKDLGYTLSREPLMPFWLLYIFAVFSVLTKRFLKLLGKDIQIQATPGIIIIATTEFTVSHEAFCRDFDYKPILSWEESKAQMKEFVKTLLTARN